MQTLIAESGMCFISSQNWLLLQQQHLEKNSKKQNTDASQIRGLEYLMFRIREALRECIQSKNTSNIC